MSHVFVVDTRKMPLDPVHPGEARLLLKQGKAAVLKRFPFTIILKVERVDPQVQPLRVKIDPGSRTTGIAVVNDATGKVVFAGELTHRGQAICDALLSRQGVRRGRRARHTRYRKPRFLNRSRPKGWLAPSLMSRVSNVLTWVKRLQRVCPIAAISQELVRFDLQQMENPEIAGVQYQQGTLAGYEIREYLLNKWNRHCAYCGKKDIPLQIEQYGFPKQHKERHKSFLGYQTGDEVKAITPKGTIQGRIVIRHRPSFRIGKVDIHPRYMRRVHRADGYSYEKGAVSRVPPCIEAQGYPRHGF